MQPPVVGSDPSAGSLSQLPTVHVSTGTDASYLPWCATTLLSVLRSTRDARLVLHVFCDDDVDDRARQRLDDMVRSEGGELHVLAVDRDALGSLPPAVAAHGGAISCARLLLPELLPEVERIVYVDADTLAVRSVTALASSPLDGRPLGAVRNVVHPDMRARVRDLGLDPANYLNSGVLVMDLAAMRAGGTGEATLRYIRDEGDRLLWVDQDALNVVFAGAWAALHPQWNAQNSFWTWRPWAAELFGEELLAEAVSDPGVLHFEGPWLSKPWHYLCQHPYAGRYRQMLAATPWSRPLVDRTVATRAVRLLPAGLRLRAFLRLQRLRAGRAQRSD
jgi:lipopolysaccharide biosynthesis glycosyltransferase